MHMLVLSAVVGSGYSLAPAPSARYRSVRRSCSFVSHNAYSLVMNLPDLTPTDRGAPARPFLRHAAKMLESTDPIDAAYSHLRTPDAARQVHCFCICLWNLLTPSLLQLTLRMSLLLSPLTGSSAPLSALSSLSSVEEPMTAPLRPALRLLPHARPRLARAAVDDDENEKPQSALQIERPSLLQRLGGLW
jgi:hypothetical protein